MPRRPGATPGGRPGAGSAGLAGIASGGEVIRMSMFLDSPIAPCPVCKEYVLTDQTQAECAREHGCTQPDCPLRSWFSGEEFREQQPLESAAGQTRRR